MDSAGHSGSLQSSSGNDDEYDSRSAVPFNPPPPFPFANNFQIPNFNSPWPGTRSDPNPITHSFVPQQLVPLTMARAAADNNHSNVTLMQQSTEKNASARNPKKRSRASRRAPTTVLNTDTSNFRAMVQQFTGIPSTPFHDNNNVNNTSMNINKRSRLSDLFGNITSSNGSGYPSPYILRPFAQKPTPSPLASSSLNNNNSLLSTIMTDQEGARKFGSNVFDVQNPIGMMNSLVFQNNPSFPISNDQLLQSGSSSSFGSYMMIPTTSNEEVYYHNNSVAKMGDHQFGLASHGNEHVTVSGLPNLISSEQKDNQNEAAAISEHNNNIYNYKLSVSNRNGVLDGEPTVKR